MAKDYSLEDVLAQYSANNALNNVPSSAGSYDLANALNNNQPQTVDPQTAEQPAVSQDDNDIDPKLPRNNTPFQDIIRIAGLIERVGLPTKWEKSIPCPCINPVSGQPKSDCPICRGQGIVYLNPVMLQVAYQSNDKGPVSGQYGLNELGTTIATPQITENGIENGISFRDRLTIPNMPIAQSFIFNVTEDRVANGMFIPYKVKTIDTVVTIDDNNKLEQLSESNDYTFDAKANAIYIDPRFINQNISINLSAELRYYVSDIQKETRTYQVKKLDQKEVAEGNGNKLLKNYITTKIDPKTHLEIEYYRAPKKLLLKREDLFIDVSDFSANKRPKGKIMDTKHYDDSMTNLLRNNYLEGEDDG